MIQFHVHLCMDFQRRHRISKREDLALFNTVVPQDQRSGSVQRKGRQDHSETFFFYVQIEKVGSLLSHANYLPFEQFQVKDRWLIALLQSGKLTTAKANEE